MLVALDGGTALYAISTMPRLANMNKNDFTKGFDKLLMTLSKEMILFVNPLTSTDL